MTVCVLLSDTNPILRETAAKLLPFGNQFFPMIEAEKDRPVPVHTLKQDMIDTIEYHNALGLAGPQIGLPYRMIVVRLSTNELKFMINPVISKQSKPTTSRNEGCLSLPNKKCDVPRYDLIKVSWMDENGQVHTMKFRGLEAYCIQHEIDHLNGKLMVDYQD